MFSIYKKELGYYLNSPIGYIIAILFGIFANFLFVKDMFVVGSASMRSFFTLIPWLFVIFIPALSMRSIAEEKRNNTLERLLTLPISETEIVLGKFLALMTLLAIGLALTFGLPISLSFFARLYLPEILVGYLGLLFLGALCIAVSLYFSTQTKNQVIAFLTAGIVLFLLTILSTDFLATTLPKFMQDFLSYFGPLYHLENFVKGVIDLRSVFYFVSFSLVFLLLTIIDLEKRK